MATEVDERVSNFRDVEEEEDEDEALSLSDFPVFNNMEDGHEIPRGPDASDPPAGDDFEFKAFVPGSGPNGGLTSELDEAHMCAADDVFFQGQILPLRLSVSSDCGSGLLNNLSRGPSRCGSSSSSSSSTAILDRNSSGSRGSSRSMSRSSSSSISRSQSTHSCTSFPSSSGGDSSARNSISSNFYAHPSPKPHLPSKGTGGTRRRSTSSVPPGWGLFRLGLVRGPEIELLQDARRPKHHRRASFASSAGSVGASRRSLDGERPSGSGSECKSGGGAKSRGDGSSSTSDTKGRLWRLILQNGLSCKCSSKDVREPIKSPLLSKETKGESGRLQTKEDATGSTSRRHRRSDEGRCRSSRTFQWLERELPVSKAAVA